MNRKFLQVIGLIMILLVAACSQAGTPSSDLPVERQAVINLVCGPENQADCIASVCENEKDCPLFAALSDPVVFEFVKTYSACEGCNTPQFPPELGIDKCIETLVSENSSGWTVTFSVSENCSFRYGSPAESRIRVEVGSDAASIWGISPQTAYIADPLYCQAVADCLSLSGSGVAFIGCSNPLYAPLNRSGYYAGNECSCVSGHCVEK